MTNEQACPAVACQVERRVMPAAWMTVNDWGNDPHVTRIRSVADAWSHDSRQVTPLYALTDEQRGDLMAVERIRHDFAPLAEFHLKHALGPMLAPSCLVCGQQTMPEELDAPCSVAIQHAELRGIVVCKQCRDAALATRHNATVSRPREAACDEAPADPRSA